ncbi:hypothetical protein HDU91_005156 [Kappamyces sp. JEL0680]|nr:hypothetical protein HDU91_005156 [Kappamyces sp. JEL0680]
MQDVPGPARAASADDCLDYDYCDPVNPNLICSICHSPFLEPITVSCQHTFCLECFSSHIEKSEAPAPYCVLCKEPIDLKWTQSRIVSLMVDELPVFCFNKEYGCSWTGERQHDHVEECKQFLEPCVGCEVLVSSVRISQHNLQCPGAIVSCTYSHLGCSWEGRRREVAAHLSECYYEKLQGFFALFERERRQLLEENAKLKITIGELESQLSDVRKSIFPLAPNEHPGFLDETAAPPFFVNTLARDVIMVKTDVEAMAMDLSQREMRRDAEYIRLRDELNSMRTVCQSLQMQMFNLALRKSSAASSPHAGVASSSTKL